MSRNTHPPIKLYSLRCFFSEKWVINTIPASEMIIPPSKLTEKCVVFLRLRQRRSCPPFNLRNIYANYVSLVQRGEVFY